MEGSATYNGAAAGVYVVKDIEAGRVKGATQGQFTAAARLRANFGTATDDGGSIHGAITGFKEMDGAELSGWRMTLDATNFGSTADPFASETTATISGGTESLERYWRGNFYEAGPATSPNPMAVAGELDAHGAGAHIAGAFGANRQDDRSGPGPACRIRPPRARDYPGGRRGSAALFCVPSMTDSSEVQVLYPARWRRRISEAQGRRREAGSEGSVEQSRDPMDKNRIRGLPGRTSGQMAAKSTAIKGRGGKFGGCAVKAVSLTSGGLRRVRKPRTERVRKDRHRGAEISRGHSSRCADEGPNDGQGQ